MRRRAKVPPNPILMGMKNALAKDCDRCQLRDGCTQVVWGCGPLDAEIIIVGEAPGRDEDEDGIPFMGVAGRELDHLLARHGIRRNLCYSTNVVKCRPPGNRDPRVYELAACERWLKEEMKMLTKAKWIIAVGRYATRWFKPDANMELVHGRPFDIEEYPGIILIPCFHVAAGLHDPSRMIQVQADFDDAKAIIHDKFVPAIDDWKDYETYEEVTDLSSLKYMLGNKKVRESNMVAVDTETKIDGSPLCLTFSTHEGSGFLISAERQDLLDYFSSVVSSPEITTILHNALFDLPVLSQMGVFPRPAGVRDTMVMAYLKQGEPQGLKALAYRYKGMVMQEYKEVVGDATKANALRYLQRVMEYDWPDAEPITERPKGVIHVRQPQNIRLKANRILKDTEAKGADPFARWYKIDEKERAYVEQCLGIMKEASLEDIPRKDATYYACRDADATFRIYPELWYHLDKRNLVNTFEIDMAVIPMALDMMQTGIKVDIPHLESLSVIFQKALDEKEKKLAELTGKQINPSAHDQVADLLFNKLRLKPIKKTKGGKNSTAEEVLARLRGGKHDNVIELIQDYREIAKLKGTYSDTIPKQARGDGRVHGTIRLTRTATGRLSMANPNLQNQPVRSEEGRKIRKGFIASDGCSLVSSDYSQIELRMMAHESQDPLMLDIFRSGKDIHAITASEMFGIPIHQLDKMAHRYPAKRTNFGIAYDITAQGLYRDFQIAKAPGWTVDKCQELIDEWFKLYKGVYEWKKSVVQQARLNGFVTDMFGRRRYVPSVRCADSYIHEKALREAGNMPIQAGAQGVIKVAMGKLVPVVVGFREKGFICNPLIQIHDDLLFEIEDRALDTIIPVIKTTMENAVKLSIPTPVDPEVGKNWAELYKWRKAA